MQEPTVSVIVTTYNREEYLKEAVQSILNQTYKDFELIVVDNYSNYDFFKVIEGFSDNRIRSFQNANNGIIAVNRNYGISKAKGRYLAFCDDDDLWKPDKLSRQLEAIQNDADIVCTGLLRFSSIVLDEVQGVVDNSTRFVTLNDLLYKYPIALSSVLIKRSDSVLFNEQKFWVAIEDYELWLRLYFEGYRIKIINTPLICYRDNLNNTSSIRSNKVLLPIKRISVLSSLKVRYNFSGYKYVYYVMRNLIEYVLKSIKY